MRTPFTIGRAAYIKAGVDEDGYSTAAGWSPTIEAVAVYGWQPLASEMPVGAELSHRVITSKTVLIPDATTWHVSDKVWLQGTFAGEVFTPTDSADVFYVNDVRDFNTGPFGYKPGGTVTISRTQG